MGDKVKPKGTEISGTGKLQRKKRPKAVGFLYFLLGFLGAGAIGGGIALLIDPTGGMLGMPADEVLKRSPFSDFFIPGILLLAVFGLLPLCVLYALVRRPEWGWADALNPFKDLHPAWTLSLYVGFGQIIWIMAETYIMNAVSLIHVLYMTIGLLIQIAALLPSVQEYFRLPHAKGSPVQGKGPRVISQ